jgi:predicted DNA-binding protein YlxM (UPF0122 family)
MSNHPESLAMKVCNLHYENNLTFAEIAERFGGGMTRNSIAGIVHRHKEKYLKLKAEYETSKR